jgi:hypothetical protein
MGICNGDLSKGRLNWCRGLNLLVPAMALSSTIARAQSVLVPSVQIRDPIPSVEQASATRLGTIAAPPLRQPSDPAPYPLHWGPILFHPSLGYGVSYGDGILREPNAPQTTVLHTVSPGVSMELGQYWDLVFGAGINRYSNAGFKNNVGYNLALSGNIPKEKWAFNFGYGWSLSDQPQIETGVQTDQQNHSFSAGASYNRSTRLSYDFGVSQTTQLTEQFANYWTWSTSEWMNYQATTRTSLGLGLSAGYNLIDPGDDSFYEQINGRIVWRPSPKVIVQLTAGLQIQHFIVKGFETNVVLISTNSATSSIRLVDQLETGVYPIFGASIAYQIFEPTSLSVAANRSLGNSVISDQFTETTSLSVGIRQKFLKHFSLDVRPGYSLVTYRSTAGQNQNREDEQLSIYAGVSTVLFRKLNIAVFYQYNDNLSTTDELAFTSTQVGLRMNYRY